jgi:hypothetical protein
MATTYPSRYPHPIKNQATGSQADTSDPTPTPSPLPIFAF